MYASNSIEERILEIQKGKENLSDTVIDGKQASQNKRFSTEAIKTLFDYRDDEDKGLISMDAEMSNHIDAALFHPADNINDIIQHYILKITEPPKDDEIINEFDIAKKGEEIPDSDDEIESPPKVGDKRPSDALDKPGAAKKAKV